MGGLSKPCDRAAHLSDTIPGALLRVLQGLAVAFAIAEPPTKRYRDYAPVLREVGTRLALPLTRERPEGRGSQLQEKRLWAPIAWRLLREPTPLLTRGNADASSLSCRSSAINGMAVAPVAAPRTGRVTD